MKKLQSLLFILLINLVSFNYLDAQELPVPSSKGELEQRVGLTDFTISYSRPNMNGRVIFGDLVPYGKVWRAGANMATTIEFNSIVDFAGTKVEPGKYSIFISPEADNWKISLNTVWNTSGTGDYDPANNVASITAKVLKASPEVETWTIGFDAVKEDNAFLTFRWADVLVKVAINAPSKELANANIEATLAELNDVYGTYNNIARYYLSTGNNADALKYAEMSAASAEKFWNVKVLSEAYAANGQYKKAIEAAEKSLKLSQEADYQPYIKMNTENIAKWKAMK
jgi:hypothetical protein